MGKSLPTSFIPEEDQGYAFVQIQLPDAASLQRTDAVMRKLDDILAHTHGVQELQRHFGLQPAFQHLRHLYRLLFPSIGALGGTRDTGTLRQGLMQSLNQKMGKEIPEAIGFAFGPPAIPGLGTAGGFTFMLQDRSGGTVKQLSDTLDKLTQAARKRPEIARLSRRSGHPCHNSTWKLTRIAY